MGALKCATRSGSEIMLPRAAVDGLRSGVLGGLLGRGDDGYDSARAVFNAMIDSFPALIVQCAGAADVKEAVMFAREHSLLASIRGAGHGVTGNAVCDDGLVIDLSRMRSVRADPVTQTARAEGGAGMVITGSGAVSFPIGAASHKQPGLSHDRFVPGLTALADAVHDAGSLLCIQLTHHGKSARVDISEDRPLLVP